MYPDIIFQILPPCSRLITSYHVTCHVTSMSHAFPSSKRKRKQNPYKIRKKKKEKRKKKKENKNC